LLLAAALCGNARPFRKLSPTSCREAKPQEKVIKKNLAESHRHSALCGGKPQLLVGFSLPGYGLR